MATAFITDKEQTKSGLIMFRRGDVAQTSELPVFSPVADMPLAFCQSRANRHHSHDRIRRLEAIYHIHIIIAFHEARCRNDEACD